MKHAFWFCILLIGFSGCVMFHASTLIVYTRHDFRNSFQKYLIKDGYVKYYAVDTSVVPDTTWMEVYFDDFGSREYIRIKSKTEKSEWYKTDSIQYSGTAQGYFESPVPRREDVPMEKAVLNRTSKFSNGAYMHKPMDRKFTENRKYKRLVGGFCWSYINVDSVQENCDVLYYGGVPISMHINNRHHVYKYRNVVAETIDTTVAFPLVLKIKSADE